MAAIFGQFPANFRFSGALLEDVHYSLGLGVVVRCAQGLEDVQCTFGSLVFVHPASIKHLGAEGGLVGPACRAWVWKAAGR